MSGFSKDCVNALILGKEINVILFNKNDIEASLKKEGEFKRILLEKLRIAAEEGSPMVPVDYISEVSHGENIVESSNDNKNLDSKNVEEFTIICEGKTDKILLEIIGRRITKKPITIIEAMGSCNIPLMANTIIKNKKRSDKIILVADSDGDEERVQHMFEMKTEGNNWSSIIINNSIEDWFGINEMDMRRNGKDYLQKMIEQAETLDLHEHRKKIESFNKYCSLLES